MKQVFPWITPAVLIGGLFGLWRLLEAMRRDFRQEIGEARQTMHRDIGAVIPAVIDRNRWRGASLS